MRNGCAFLLGIALLVACGGGGGGGGGSTGGGIITPATTTPTTAPTPTITPSTGPASASGTLVDADTGAPMSGISVGLAPNTVGATPSPVATTDANGKFSFTAAPGTYLMQIPAATPLPNRPTIHEMITLAAGANVLKAPSIGPSPTTIQSSGDFRLTTMSAIEQNCVSYENQKRVAISAGTVVADEWLQEDSRALAALNGGAYPGSVSNFYNAGQGISSDCTGVIDTSFALSGSSWPKETGIVWFAGALNSTAQYGYIEGMGDPRGPMPSPTPTNPWP